MPKLAPRHARKYSDILRLARTVEDTPRSWLHLTHTGEVMIVNQRMGESATGQVKLTRSEFERFMRFYNAGQRVRP